VYIKDATKTLIHQITSFPLTNSLFLSQQSIHLLMEKIEEGDITKEKMAPDMDSSSMHVEEFQAEKHDKDPNVEQNLMDPNLKR